MKNIFKTSCEGFPMNDPLINLFGDYLSNLIGKPSLACKGLIRFSIKNYLKNKGFSENKAISFEQFLEITRTIIKQQLILAELKNIDEIIERFVNQIYLQKAIFTMGF